MIGKLNDKTISRRTVRRLTGDKETDKFGFCSSRSFFPPPPYPPPQRGFFTCSFFPRSFILYPFPGITVVLCRYVLAELNSNEKRVKANTSCYCVYGVVYRGESDKKFCPFFRPADANFGKLFLKNAKSSPLFLPPPGRRTRSRSGKPFYCFLYRHVIDIRRFDVDFRYRTFTFEHTPWTVF